MTRINASEVRTGLRRAERGARVVVQRRGKDVAAIVPLGDLARLAELEDLQAAAAARAEMERTGEKPIPYHQIRKEAGLE
jgi:antitoxin (DNA-binding transcriptional repressor) of toxin-antitoxin stability system